MKEDAEKRELDSQVNKANSAILKALKEVWTDFEANESWIEAIKSFKPPSAKSLEEDKENEELEEQEKKSCFAPSLNSILEATRRSSPYYNAQFIKES